MINLHNFRKVIGLAGVAKSEEAIARLWGRRLEYMMVLIAIWLPLQWHMENHHTLSYLIGQTANWTIWAFFVLETITLLLLVRNRFYYLSRNWMNLLIIVLGLPVIWQQTPLLGMLRGLQLLLMLRLMLPWWNTSVHFLSRNRLGSTLLAVCVTTTLAGVLMAAIDPNFSSPWTGIWWAWQTVTTVGYGDYVPVSFVGRALAIIIMILGLGFLSLLTANFSAYIISRGTNKVVQEENMILKKLEEMNHRLKKLEKSMEQKP